MLEKTISKKAINELADLYQEFIRRGLDIVNADLKGEFPKEELTRHRKAFLGAMYYIMADEGNDYILYTEPGELFAAYADVVLSKERVAPDVN